ncbi:hypothetical protein L209DRAFT_747081 [Thermothelomyces heterothallicus CBS 203.75]
MSRSTSRRTPRSCWSGQQSKPPALAQKIAIPSLSVEGTPKYSRGNMVVCYLSLITSRRFPPIDAPTGLTACIRAAESTESDSASPRAAP